MTAGGPVTEEPGHPCRNPGQAGPGAPDGRGFGSHCFFIKPPLTEMPHDPMLLFPPLNAPLCNPDLTGAFWIHDGGSGATLTFSASK